MKRLTLLPLMLLMAMVANAKPATHYVASAGELSALEQSGSVAAGDVLVWRDGTYADEDVVLCMDGVTLKAESMGGVKFTGSSKIVIDCDGSMVSGFQWIDPTIVTTAVITIDRGTTSNIVEECVIDGTNLEADAEHNSKWVSLYGTKHTVCHCSFINKMNMGTTLVAWLNKSEVAEHTIADNYFTRPYTHFRYGTRTKNGQETIRIGTSGESMSPGRCTVTGNHFYHCHGERGEIISNKSCFNIYEGNLFDASIGTLTLRHGNDCVVEDNYFVNDEMVDNVGGVRVIGERHKVLNNYIEHSTGVRFNTAICTVKGMESSPLNGYYQVKGALIDGNVLVDCKNGINANYGTHPMPVIETIISNNIIISSSDEESPVIHDDKYSPDITYSDNVIYGGTQRGVDLPTAAKKPKYKRPIKAIEKLRAEAGASYYEKVYSK